MRSEDVICEHCQIVISDEEIEYGFIYGDKEKPLCHECRTKIKLKSDEGRLKELDNLAKGIESNVYTSCLVNIFPQDFDNIYWAIKTVKDQRLLIESQARILEGFISDAEDIKARLDEVRDNVNLASATGSLEEHDTCLYEAKNELNYLIDFKLQEITSQRNN